MRHSLLIIFIAASLSFFSQSAFTGDVLNTFPLNSDAMFADANRMLQAYAKTNSHNKTNTFCVLGVTADDKSHVAWIIWKQKAQMILWEGQDLNKAGSRRVLDLKKDVVKTQTDVGSSTYLVTRDWVDQIEKACAKDGEKIEIR
jgi:hypothetical protein